MDAGWIGMTASMLIAACASMVALRQMWEGRARTAARIEALRSAAFTSGAAVLATGVDDAPGAPEGMNHAPPAMFSAAEEVPSQARRWIALAAVGGATHIVAAVALLQTSPAELAATPAATSRTPAANTSAPGPGAVGSPAPIALLALRHTAGRDARLTVTGLVQNVSMAHTLRGVITVVSVFDRQGTRLATREAALELPVISPGRESPFVANIANVRDVARYEVAFRLSDGTSLAHVDRRAAHDANDTRDTNEAEGHEGTPR